MSGGEVQNEWSNTSVPTCVFMVYRGRTIFLYFSNRWTIIMMSQLLVTKNTEWISTYQNCRK
jgi:hypothetical protein